MEKKSIKKVLRKRLLGILLFLMVLTLIALALAPSFVKIVGPGEAGVLYKTFWGGTVTRPSSTYGEGIHIIYPWDSFYIYDVRIQEKNTVIDVITKDGLTLEVEISVRFHPNVSTLGLLHKYVGPDYIENVIAPEIEATTRDIIGLQDLDSLYSDKRAEIQRKISSIALDAINNQNALINNETINEPIERNDFEPGRIQEYIIFEELFIKNIAIPATVRAKIEEKIIAEQELRRYEYLIAAEEKEKERRLIEARGIKLFEDSAGISILKWRSIMATEELSKSPNSKIILIGTDESLPIILNGDGN